MSNLVDITGKKYGCWKVLGKAESRVMNCGTTRVFWKLECAKCQHVFERSYRNIMRRREFPQDCPNCASKSQKARQKYYRAGTEKTHLTGKPCGQNSPYLNLTTEDKKKVTCGVCLKMIRLESSKLEKDYA